VRLEGLGKLKKKKIGDLIGNRTHDFSACNIVPEATTLPRDPRKVDKANGMQVGNLCYISNYTASHLRK
jgi:hypothetical protein